MRQIDSVRKLAGDFDRILGAARAEFMAGSGAGGGALESLAATPDPDSALEALRGARGLESLGSSSEMQTFGALEAIILDKLRPPYLILRDRIEMKGDYDRADLIQARKAELETVAKSVGRVDLLNHSTLRYGGTGWLVEEDVAVTNRHVAEIFAEKNWLGAFEFRRGAFDEQMEARLDYVRQLEDGGIRRRADVVEVLYVAGPREPDVAFLRVETRDDVEPLELFTGRVADETPVAAVGYPASDGGRNDPQLMAELFGDRYDVKRFSPGLVTGHQADGVIVLGDYTSLGGNSGSPVLALDTGKAVGLHFAGAFRDSNYAVASDIVAAALARVRTRVAVPELPVEAPTSPPDSFAGRAGYDADFLGAGDLRVPLPRLGSWADDVAPVSDDSGGVLKYRHFSVVQSRSRRLPLFTAVNIDGARSFRLRRTGTWRLDARIAPEHQIGNELYRSNPLDRGHMVRRRDPGWGADRDEAQEAEIDTFHYTNSTPQHEDLNQKTWVGLEDYVLESAETRDFKVSVFTGPVFRDDDRRLKAQPGAEDVPIPEEFWKVAVMVNDDTGELSATGYVLSQGTMIRDLVEAAFVLGQYETYQVQLAKIEAATGLDFGSLKDHDPLGAELDVESPFGQVALRIGGPDDLRL
jgi:endonuclease G, mitochondrial